MLAELCKEERVGAVLDCDAVLFGAIVLVVVVIEVVDA